MLATKVSKSKKNKIGNIEVAIKVPAFNKQNGFSTSKERSIHMSKIRGKDTKPELKFRKALYGRGVRFRVGSKSMPGKPDVSNISRKFVVFIDGEFWHGYNWTEKKVKIKSNRDFWIPKIERNMQKDHANNKKLEDMGFTVFRFWADEVNKNLDTCINQVLDFISRSTP